MTAALQVRYSGELGIPTSEYRPGISPFFMVIWQWYDGYGEFTLKYLKYSNTNKEDSNFMDIPDVSQI
jgi:hypothetical protein